MPLCWAGQGIAQQEASHWLAEVAALQGALQGDDLPQQHAKAVDVSLHRDLQHQGCNIFKSLG